MAKKVEHLKMDIEGQPIPFLLHREYRNSVRFAVGKKGILIRIPKFYSKKDAFNEINRAVHWVKSLKVKKPRILDRYILRTYSTGDQIQIYDRSYTINLEEYSNLNKYSRANLKSGIIHIKLAETDPSLKDKTLKTLLSRVISQDCLPEISRRVKELNHLHFQQEIKNVRLKYNHSNWGSCSTKGNINLSSRLLFAPLDVQDYVIIHELAHLIEHNHSPRFWKLVKDAMPDYIEKEQWLKINGSKCDF
ncbi:MAG: M48 family metallopeptidase [Bacteroidia bacterium]|nr:M48 family metallopeptidase [Bacteroidia bacterium]